MSFKAFDKSKMEQYEAQAREKWGKTEAYKEFEKKTAGKTSEQMAATGDGLMDIFRELGAVSHLAPESEEVQALIGKLQTFITEHYYTCTKPILSGLGQMYVADERFKTNIDAAGGQGCAEFVSKAIEFYCK